MIVISMNYSAIKIRLLLRAIVNQDLLKAWSTPQCIKCCYMISAAIVSIGGALYAQYIQYIDPLSILPLSNSRLIVLVVLMGGIGTVWGPVLGAFIMTFINQYSRALFNQAPGLNMVIYGVLVVIIILFLPNGIFSLFTNRRKKKIEI